MNLDDHITPNFKWGEFLRAEDPLPSSEILGQLRLLAQTLERVRTLFGNKPIHINSGYRTFQHNLDTGGKPNSYHLRGMAADIVVQGVPPHEVQKELKSWIGGMGCYKTFTHIDIRPYRVRW